MGYHWTRFSDIISHIDTAAGALERIPGWLRSRGFSRLLLVDDLVTHGIAGNRLAAMLEQAGGFSVDCLTLAEREPVADERSIGAVLAALQPTHELVIAVGSGTINDLCKYVSFKSGRAFIIAGTAPSMDGYASTGAAMTLGGMKLTPQTHAPLAIFCDTDILKDAPMAMLAAGLGDMLGKINALADWRLSHILTGEPMPPEIVSLVDDAVRACRDSVAAARRREPQAIEHITRGLILSGLAMSLYGDSRPASGTEHHLAHYWEMRFLSEGRPAVSHGLKVGVATVCALTLWKSLPATPVKIDTPSGYREKVLRRVREGYGASADALVSVENPNLSFDMIASHWPAIRAIADSLPEPDEVAALLRQLDAPVTPGEIGVNAELLAESILLARERKKTYTLLQLLGDLNRLEDSAADLCDGFARAMLERVKLFVLDMDGTIYLGDELFPFAPDFLRRIRESGRDFVFFTNNSSKNPDGYLRKLERMGIPVPPEKLLMSTQVIIDFLLTERPGQRVWAAGTPELLEQLRKAGIDPQADEPEIVVLGFDTTLDYEKLLVIHKALEGGAELYGVNPDYVCPVPGGSIPDCGAMMQIFSSITGQSYEFFGKPSRRTLDFILRHTGYAEDELCFVGDRLYTDIAIASGTRASSILVLSGEACREDLARFPQACPDMIVQDVSRILL